MLSEAKKATKESALKSGALISSKPNALLAPRDPNRNATMRRTFAALSFSLLAGAALAAPPSRDQGDWPCRQIKVADLSLAAVWSGPSIATAQKAWRDDTQVSDLVPRLAARRTPMEAAEQLVADFAKNAGSARKERLLLLFAGVYDKLDSERGEVVAGLDRYGRAQKDMAERLRERTQKLREAQDARAEPDKIKELSDALQWEMRVFDERRKAVTFVCETPALIEQRLGYLARSIESALQ
jgi:hypothetical protein